MATLQQVAETFTYTEALTLSFEPTVGSFVTSGRVTAGDGGGALYLRWVSGMPALASGQQGFSWFEDATGSQWVLAPGQDFYIAQFGGIGGSGLDAGTIINKALDAPMVKILRTGNLEHYFSGDIFKPSGKWLISELGEGWLRAIPVVSEGEANRTGIYCEDDNNGGFYGLRVDVQRSGIGLSLNKRCNGIVVRGSPVNVQVIHCDVYNATGYGHYTSVESEGTGSVIRDKCRSFNCEVSFECGADSTGSATETRIDCEAYSGSSSVFDGGSLIANETHYHEYGLIEKVINVRCKARGPSGAPCNPITVGANIGEVGYLDCDIETTSAVPALAAIGQDGFAIGNVWIRGGRFVSPGGIGASFTNAIGSVDRAYLQGVTGCIVTTGATVDFYAPNIQSDISSGGTAAAIALSVQGTGVARWHGGGSLVANGPSGLENAFSGPVTFFEGPRFDPPSARIGTRLPAYRQRHRGKIAASSWSTFNPSGTPLFQFINIILPTSVVARANVDVLMSLQNANGSKVAVPSGISLVWNWQSDAVIQVQVPPGIKMNNIDLAYYITEFVS